jgi:phosphatidylglycerol:prolipoprotein diacylglycerol transferase
MALTFPEINPVAFEIGPLQVHWYALAYMAGFILGWRLAVWICRLDGNKYRPNDTDIDDFMSWAILGVLLGGRLGYVLFYNLPTYVENPLGILKLWQGGMSFHGGVIGVAVVTTTYALLKKISLLRLTDLFAVSAPIGFFFGRIANFINGELYGRVTDVPWGMVFPRAEDGALRHPSQLYQATFEGLLLFLILLALIRIPKIRNVEGLVSAAFLIFGGIFRFGIEFFREPDVQLGFVFERLSMGQILSVPMMLLGGVVFVIARRNHARSQQQIA